MKFKYSYRPYRIEWGKGGELISGQHRDAGFAT